MTRIARPHFFGASALILFLALSMLPAPSLLRPGKAQSASNDNTQHRERYGTRTTPTAPEHCPTCKPPTQQTIYAPLFDVPEAASSEIVLNCRSVHTVDLTPTFYTIDGTAI